MKKFLSLCMVSFMALTLVGCGSEDSDQKKVGIIQYAEHPALDASYEGFIDGLKEEGFGEDAVKFDYQNASNDVSNCETIADKLANGGNDLIYAIATPAAQAVAKKTMENQTPVLLAAVTDPKSAGLVKENDKPGGNVSGTSDLTPIKDQLTLLTQLLPNAKRIAIMYCNGEDNSIFQANIAKEAAKELGLDYVEATVSDSNQIQQVTESLIGKVDAIYIPTDNLLAEGMAAVASVANENNLPCIVGEGGMVSNGGLATYGVDYYKLGYMTGVQAAKILKGEAEPATMAIEYLPAEECELKINQSVAEKLNISIPKEIADKAVFVK